MLTRSRAAGQARGGFVDVDSEGQKTNKNLPLEPVSYTHLTLPTILRV